MSIEYNARRILTDGLVLYLDASLDDSYVSGSTTWNDLSGYNNHGTIHGNPTYNSDNGGSIVFDGTGDKIQIVADHVASGGEGNSTLSAAGSVGGTPGEITLEAVIYITGNTHSNISSKHFNNGFRWRYAPPNDQLEIIFDHDGPPGEDGTPLECITNSNTLLPSTWSHVVVRFSQTGENVKVYINGVRYYLSNVYESSYLQYPVESPAGSVYQVGTASTEYFAGRIALYRHYDRALSDGGVGTGEIAGGEIAYNFNLLKDRFGL